MPKHTVVLAVENASAMGRGVVQGAASFAHSRGCWQFVMATMDARRHHGTDASPGSADGIIGVITPDLARAWRGRMRRYAVNVSRGRRLPGGANVICDDRAIGRLAAEYLLGKGLEHFAYAGYGAKKDQRHQAFSQRVEASGASPGSLYAWSETGELTEAILALPRPCGVLCFNDVAAVRIIEQAIAAGLEVPRDLAVVGVDNDVLINTISPVPLTSIENDFETIGHEAARLLDGILAGAEPPDEPILFPPVRVVERHSTDFPGDLHPLAVAAARTIRLRACRAVSLPEMLADLPASYRTLDRRFREAFGRPLQAEVTRARMAEAVRLLTTTRMAQREIAERTGYGDVHCFSKAFRKAMGKPPGAYRTR